VTVKLHNGSIFLHIPKTGGTWVEHVLKALGLYDSAYGHEHADFDRVLNRDRFYFGPSLCWHMAKARLRGMNAGGRDETMRKFCFVRNPFSWYESWFKYMSGLDWKPWGEVNSAAHWHPNSGLNGLGSEDFNEFVWNVVKKRPGYVSELYYSYTKPGIDYVGRTETLERDLIHILRCLQVEFDEDHLRQIGRKNESKKPKKALDWDPEVRRLVEATELPALIQFGYIEQLSSQYPSALRTLPAHPALIVE